MNDRSLLSVDQDDRLAEALDAYLAALEGGTPLDVKDFLARYSDLSGELRECLASLAFIRRAGKMSVAGDIPTEGETAAGVLGDFRILREIGKGGMGVVYEAEQISLQRRVALKVLPFAATMDPRHLQRFHNEARAAACLDHPHIVKVFAVGCERAVHYFAMKFIEGQSLAEFIAAQRHVSASGKPQRLDSSHQRAEAFPSSPTATQLIATATTQGAPRDVAHYRRSAEWGIQAAEALEHAHGLGIVHRDIKPANLMIDAQGMLWITDFGLARTATDAGLTMTGDVVGTLRYMSPEQALAKHGLVDHRTDLYALGTTLYELLCLHPAVDGKDREEILRKIAFEEPPSPRSLDRTIPADLETIVLKAMSKEPACRYATAQELADDLRRYLEHKPIRARRPELVDRLAKWGRRHRTLVLAGVIFLVLAVGGLAAGIVLIAQEQTETAKARDLAMEREQSLRQILYVQDIRQVWQALREGERERMRGPLDRHIPDGEQEDLRGFEWWYLQRRSLGVLHEAARVSAHQGGAYCLTYSPDGLRLASAGKDGGIRFWDARTLAPQGELRGGQGEINEVAFVPDGKTLASAGDDGTVWFWDLATARRRGILRPEGCRDELSALAISPDSKILAAGGKDGQLWTWDLATGKLKAKLNPGAAWIFNLSFSPDGRFLAAANAGGQISLLDPATLRECEQLRHPYGEVNCVSFSHDGRTLAAGYAWGGRILLWDLTTRTLRHDLSGHEGSVIRSLSFSSDDTLLVSVRDDGLMRLWNGRSVGPLALVRGHAGRVWCTAFAPDGERLATASQDETVKLWHVHGDDHRRTIRVAAEANKWVTVDWAAFSPDGQTLFTRSSNGELGRWSTSSGGRVEPAAGPAAQIARAALAPSSRLATVAGDQRDLHVRNLSGAAAQVYRHARPISAVSISPDGERVAFADDSPAVWMWEVGPARPWELARLSGVCKCLAFAPDDGMIAVAAGAQVLLQDAVRGHSRAILSGHERNVGAMAVSPDGRLLATAALDDNTIRIWELPSGRERYCLWGHRRGVNAVAFSPDGKTLASGAGAGEVILWDIAGGRELMRLDDHRGDIHALAFSPDGKILAAGGPRGDATIAEVTLWYADGARPNQDHSP